MQFCSGILGGEAPVDYSLGFIPLLFQGGDLSKQGFFVGQPLPEAASGEDAELYFRHIQPATMLGSKVKLQLFDNASGFRCWEGLIQGSPVMGVQIVQDHPHLLHIGVGLVHQPAHPVGKVLPGALLRYFYMPPARQGFTGHEQIAGSFPPVLLVHPLRLPRLGRQWFPDAGQQLGGTLIEADHRPLGGVGFGVQVQDILHVGHKVGAHLGGCTTPASAKD